MHAKLGFLDPATILMEGIIELHHYIMFYLIIVVIFVSWMLFSTVYSFMEFSNTFTSNDWVRWTDNDIKTITPWLRSNVVWTEDNWKNFINEVVLKTHRITHGTFIEVVWTVIPSIILLLIAMPSFALLFSMDEITDPLLTVKAIGHQWYWSYEYSDYSTEDNNIIYDSYMVPEEELELGDLRLLEVDNALVLPTLTDIRVLVTATDVLHCWAVPSLGIKMDAVPGRLNQVSFLIKREGVFYGQCSEICGVNHGFMPIVVKAVSVQSFLKWVEALLDS